ncbi:MAG: sulfatase [Planctomycetota bacterium]|jgi:arylsulfatase A-like enzyme|nr:sulfatase [Planctomycetota bacterium]MDP6941242.1 sulfatase [Planctomycetota bacterium]
MSTGKSGAIGLLIGWAYGAFEAGLVFALKNEVVDNIMFYLVGPFAPMVIYGLGGWLFGLLVGRIGLPFPWKQIYFLGLIPLFLLRLFGGIMPSNWAWVGSAEGVNWIWSLPGFFVSFYCYRRACFVLAGAEESYSLKPKVLGTVVALPLFWVMMVFQGTDSDLTPSPLTAVASKESPNIVLVTWDTVRSDTLPLYGGEGLDTPELDLLASEGWVFDGMHAVSNITAPTHATMLSGLYPPTHGLRSNGLTGPELEIPRLPEILQNKGYAVGGFVSGYSLRGSFGFSRDFNIYDDRPIASAFTTLMAGITFSCKLAERVLPRGFLPDSSYVPGEITLGRAERWYQSTGDTPAFLWAHFYDAHHPYNPPSPYRTRALERATLGAHAQDPSVEEEWILQRGEIERIDGLLGRLIDTLENKDPGLQNTIIVVLSDHGECFGEGGHLLNHHYSLFDATQKIFCVIRPAGGVKPVRLNGTSAQVDLMPTLLSLAGMEIPDGIQGHDLVPHAGGANLPERGIYMEGFQRNLDEKRMQGWLRGEWKFVRTMGGVESLYKTDSWSEEDYSQSHPQVLSQLREELNQFLATIQTNEGLDKQSASDEANLAGLGYFDSEEE